MSLAYFAGESLLKPGVINNRSDLTREEWLEKLQKKSIAQGRPLTWRQIKDDPELDHEQIAVKLGQYAIYENSLFCSVHEAVQSKEILTDTTERDSKVTIEAKTKYQLKPKPLMELRTPENSLTFWEPYCIIAGSLNAADSKKWLSSYKVELTDCLYDFGRMALLRILGGRSRSYCVSRAIVYPDRVELTVRQINTPSTDDCLDQRVVMTVKPGVETRLFLGLSKRNAKNYDEYAICSCKNTDGKTSIEIMLRQS